VAAPEDLAAFCRATYPRLVGALALYVGDRATGEDLAQEALLRAAQRWESVRAMASPQAWTYRVGINLANSWFRRRRAERAAQARSGGDVAEADAADRVAVRVAVAALPRRTRTALVLRYYLGLPVRDAAAHMNISEDAVRSLTKRALAQLRTQLLQPEEAPRA
jgi:RNA polymerase sigma-70 factor, ECF subfamily